MKRRIVTGLVVLVVVLAMITGVVAWLDYREAFGSSRAMRTGSYSVYHAYLFARAGTKNLIGGTCDVWYGPDDGEPLSGPVTVRTMVPGADKVNVMMSQGFRSKWSETRVFGFRRPLSETMVLRFDCPGYAPVTREFSEREFASIRFTNPLVVELEPTDGE